MCVCARVEEVFVNFSEYVFDLDAFRCDAAIGYEKRVSVCSLKKTR